MILAGDIGGTKTLLALYREGNPRSPESEKTFPSRDFSGLEEVVEKFLNQQGAKVERACFGLPGPIVRGRCETPNLAWEIDIARARARLGARTAFLNDLEATGYGIATLEPNEMVTLRAGEPDPEGNAVLIAPGTGLGECILFRDGNQLRPSASEGGHCDFAPRTPEQVRFLEWAMRNKRPRISFDRVASGSGLPLIYEFLRGTRGAEESGQEADAIATADDPSAEISRLALAGGSRLCRKALEFWVAVLGAEAGNLALKGLATAGIFLGGGIPPKILPALEDGKFLEALDDKGRLTGLVSRIPVKVILNDRAALFGAARYALDPARYSEV